MQFFSQKECNKKKQFSRKIQLPNIGDFILLNMQLVSLISFDIIASRSLIDTFAGGYGFEHTSLLFPTLVDFVRHYAVHSLRDHNPELDTRLTHPVYGL